MTALSSETLISDGDFVAFDKRTGAAAEAVGGGGGGVGGGGEAEAADESEEDVNLVFGGETEEDGMLLAELDLFPPFFFAMGR